jgi:hypothetical protein
VNEKRTDVHLTNGTKASAEQVGGIEGIARDRAAADRHAMDVQGGAI